MHRKFLLTFVLFCVVCLAVSLRLEGQRAGGTIQGKIQYAGAAPKGGLISMAKDPNCLKINAGKKVFQETLIVNPNNTIRNVFVHIKSGLPKKSYPAPAQAVTLEQKGCIYNPRVQGALVGQSLKIINNDQTLHNVHSQSPAYLVNVAQPIAGMTYDVPLKTEEVMLIFKCEIHPWMASYVGVLAHPFYSVSTATGTYEIRDVPPGKYVLQAWQEQLGALTQPVEVTPGGVATADFTFTSKESAQNSPGFQLQEVEIHDNGSPVLR